MTRFASNTGNRPVPHSNRSAPARLLLLALFVVAACGRDASPHAATRAGELTFEAILQTDPPRQKGNVLDLVVKDRDGRPVSGANVEVEASMPSMAWVPGMHSRAAVSEETEGRYRAEFDLLMGGTWSLDIAVESAAGSGRASYSLTPGSRGLQLTSPGAEVASGSTPGGAAAPVRSPLDPELGYPDETLASLRRALAIYEEIRTPLAAGRLDGVGPAAQRLSEALESAFEVSEPASEVGHCLTEASGFTAELATATELEPARHAFGELSRFVIALVALDPRLAAETSLYECPMTDTFNLWLQRSGELANPYMGPGMSGCGSPESWPDPTSAGASAHEHGDGAGISHYSCSMHTNVRSDHPGTCPICSMDLVPVTRAEVATGTIFVDPQRRQTIGVRTATVESRPLGVTVRAMGRVTFDETRIVDVSVKVPGWIEELRVNAPGQPVRRGETLFILYSPELYASQEELLTALRSQRAARTTSAPERADYLVAAARQRLRLWDLEDSEIDAIASRDAPTRGLPISSPVSGYVIDKQVVAGTAVEPGMRLYRIARLDRVWVEAEVYESDLPWVAVGQQARITSPSLPGRELLGRVTFLYPYLEGASRTARVRIELPNPELELRPDMYADVGLHADLGERPVVPESAVLYAGERRLVFLDLGEGHLKPQLIEIGARSGDFLEVVSGLEVGQPIVTSGTFLVAAESRLKSALEQWQ